MMKLLFYIICAVVIVSIIPLVAPVAIPVLAIVGGIWVIIKLIDIIGGKQK